MRFCLNCRSFSGNGPLCTQCGRSFGGRLCRGRTKHLNPPGSQFCNYCGTSDLLENATSIPLGWASRVFLVVIGFYAGRWVLLSLAHVSSLSFQTLTGYKDIRVWIIEEFAHVLIILFVFYFLSAFMPGEAGKLFRAALSNIVTHAIKLFFKVAEKSLFWLGRLLLKAIGINVKEGK